MRAWILLLPLLLLFLQACDQEQEAELDNVISIHAAVQLNAGELAIIGSFDPLIEESYHLKHHFQAETEDGESYLMWAYFVKEALNIWRVYITYDNRDIDNHRLVFTPAGQLDYASTRQLNDSSMTMPLYFQIEAEGRPLTIAADFSSSTQYAFITAVYYMVDPDYIPVTNRAEPVATSLLEPVVTLDNREAAPPIPDFLFSDPQSYNFMTSSYVFDALGMQHTLYLYFVKSNDSEWIVYPRLADSSEIFPEDGWAEQLSGMPSHTLQFDATGGVSLVNGAFVIDPAGVPAMGWSLDSGAVGRTTDGFVFHINYLGVAIDATAFTVVSMMQDGGW